MASIYTHQDANKRRTWILMTVFFIVVIGVSWAFSWIYGSPTILYIAVIFAVLMNFFSYWNSHKIVLAFSGAKKADPKEYRELYNIVENLAITGGLKKPKVYIINDSTPNAFATGRNEETAVVVITTGLYALLDRTELEGVIAHELSHIGNKDMLVSTLAVMLVGFVTLLSDFFLRMTIFGHMGSNRGDGRVQLFMIIAGVALAILAPIVAIMIQMAISRKREFLADASGVLLTRYPEGLASALEKIGKHSHPMKRANHATAHLFISNPFGKHGKVKGFLNKLFLTHPPMEERVKILREESL